MNGSTNGDGILFLVRSPFGQLIRTTRDHWDFIVTFKHPDLRDRLQDITETIAHPDEVRRSQSDPQVHLYYRVVRPERWIAVVVKHLNGDGFLVTAYITANIKEGERLWRR